MRGPFKFGLVGLSLAALFGVLCRAGVSVAVEDAAVRPGSQFPGSQFKDHAAADFGPVPQAALAAASADEFGPPPVMLADAGNPFATPSAFRADDPFAGLDQVESSKPAVRKKERLAALAAEVAALSSDAELDRLIGEFETTVAEKRAEIELRQARAALERVVAAFPETDAADAAREMLTRPAAEARPATLVPVEAPR